MAKKRNEKATYTTKKGKTRKIKPLKPRKKAGTAGSISEGGSFTKWSKDVGQLRSRIPDKKSERKIKHLVDLKREKEMAEKGWKVVRTKTYLEKPKEAYGKKGYPYAVLNENNHYESFYTWKEKTSKKR